MEDSRIQGFQDSSESLKNYKELQKLRAEIGDVERMLKALIESLENKHSDP
jgi:hypothetical protein